MKNNWILIQIDLIILKAVAIYSYNPQIKSKKKHFVQNNHIFMIYFELYIDHLVYVKESNLRLTYEILLLKIINRKFIGG